MALAIGLWISTLVDTQQQAMFVTFFIVNIYLLMSGLFTPIDSMAPWVQTVSQINPVRHFVTISRAILMKGAGLAEIAEPLAILAVFAVVTLTLAIRQYRSGSPSKIPKKATKPQSSLSTPSSWARSSRPGSWQTTDPSAACGTPASSAHG